MSHTLKPFICPSCNSIYSCRDTGRQHNATKYPLILPCNHSVCDGCLYSAVRNRIEFKCPVCKLPVDLSSGNDSISKLYPDLYVLGILNAPRKQNLTSMKVTMVSSPEMIQKLTSSSQSKPISKTCDNCHEIEALWQCEECQSNFCNLCFDEVHKKIKSKKKHAVKKIFAELYNTLVQTGCQNHKNKSVEFYCERDDQLTCSHCMLIGDHIGHEVKTLMDKNQSCADDLKNLLVDITGIEKRLKYTEHLLAEISTTEKIDVSDYIKAVRDHFHKLHTLLQVREAELMSQIAEIAHLQNEPFEKMVYEISGYQKEIATVKKDAESVIENPCLAVSAPYLLKKLESFKDIPCYLLPIQANMDKQINIELQLNEEFESDIKKHGSLECSIKPRFHLVPTQDLPENYVLDIPKSFVQSDVETQSNTTADSLSEDSLNIPRSSSCGIEAAFKYRDFNRMYPEVVQVSHIKDPSCFWIQRCVDSRKLVSLSDAINKWCRSREAQTKKNICIEKGDLYLVQYFEDKKWYRARVKRIIDPEKTSEVPVSESPETKHSVHCNERKVEVYYIDFGNSEIVPVSRLRNIQARFLNLAGLAKQCSLVDIAPLEGGNKWSPEAIKSFSKFVSRKQVLMQIYEEKNNVYSVDLSQVADSAITDDVPVSVRDALVFQELAVFPSGKILSSRRHPEQKFLPAQRLSANSDIAVIVSHVDSPSHFYVQQISTASYLSAMIFEMSDAYSESNSLLHSIHAPRVGMICAGQFSVDKQWYRAQVISLPGGSNVEVQYVDFGNREVIHHKYLRKLFDKFTKLNIQAIPCKLADITHNQSKCWSKEAKEWLTSKVSKKQLILKSLGFNPEEKKSEVVLFYTEDEYEICVNALMVEAGLADSCGSGSTAVRKRIENKPVPVLEKQIERTLSIESIDDPTSPISAVVDKPFPTLVKKFPDSEGNHIEVHISNIINPSVFYVRIAGDIEKKLEKLMNEMQKAYISFDSHIEDCGVGKSYAVYCDSKKQWFRGTVLSKINDEKVTVQYVDYGIEREVPTKNVQKLLEAFATDEEYSICCELTGIIPAGGSSQWSYAACDAFQELVAPHETLHLSCKENVDKDIKSLPVSLFIEEIKLGGALEATEVIYKNIALELVARGLALPLRNVPTSASTSANSCEAGTSCNENEDSSMPIKSESEAVKEESDERKVMEKEKVIAEPVFQWRPVVYPVEPKFKAFVTNIGEDGSIQLHFHSREGSSVVEMIKKALQFKYSKSNVKTLTKPPPIGEACIAKFSVDKLWYRAEVISVYPEKVKVHFVDYGNNEMLSLNEITTDIIMHTFARQCLECVIAGIHTGKPGEWDEDLLNFLHSQLVESIVEVEPLGPPDENGKLPCSIVTNCGISVAELLESMGFMGCGSSSVDSRQPCDMQETKTFQQATELREGDIFPVCITQINSPNIVYLQRLKIPEPKSDYEKEYNKEHADFLELIKELQEKAETFPKVAEPLPGLACCAQYSYDNNWYRCEITDLVENGVEVLYVDYGNSETIPSENLRDPDSHIINFPVQVHFCEIYGMLPAGDDWDPEVKKFMIKKLLNGESEIFARVVIPGKISKIDLMLKTESGDLKLAYEELVIENLITLQSN